MWPSDVFSGYRLYCACTDSKAIPENTFSKLIRRVFPNIRMVTVRHPVTRQNRRQIHGIKWMDNKPVDVMFDVKDIKQHLPRGLVIMSNHPLRLGILYQLL